MTKADKYQFVDQLSEKFAQTEYFYITDASGMTVKETNAFRRVCFEKGIEYVVAKNTLIAKALEKVGKDSSELKSKNVLKGFSGIMFSDSGSLPAKVLKEFRKKAPKDRQLPKLKGASLDSAVFVGDDQLDLLTAIKSKQELIGDVVFLLQSPAKNVISALKGSGSKIAGIVKTLSEKEQQ